MYMCAGIDYGCIFTHKIIPMDSSLGVEFLISTGHLKNTLRTNFYRKFNSKHCFGRNRKGCLLKGEERDLHMQMSGI